mgnify:FL=1
MSNELSNAERETHLNMMADDRSVWIVFTDDPVLMRKFDTIAEFVEVVGGGKRYKLRTDQVLLRAGKRTVSEENRRKFAERMKRTNPHLNIEKVSIG